MNKLYKITFDTKVINLEFRSPIFIVSTSEIEALSEFITTSKDSLNHPINNIHIDMICDVSSIINYKKEDNNG